MSGLYLWAPRLFFLWQLLWPMVYTAPIPFPKLALDPVLLTSIPPQENRPTANPPEIPAQEPEGPEVGEPYSIEEETSTPSALLSSKLLKSLFVQEELPTTPKNSEIPIKQKNSPLLQFPPASIEPSPLRREGPARHLPNSMRLKGTVSPLGSGKPRHPALPYGITPLPPKNIKVLATAKKITAYFRQFTQVVEPPSQEEVLPKFSETTKSSSSQPTSEADATALQLTIAPPEHPQDTLQHPEPIAAQQPTWPEIASRPADLQLTIKPEAAVEGERPTTWQQATPPAEHPQDTLQHPEPVQVQQPTWPEIVGRPADLQLTVKLEASVKGERPTTRQQATPPAEHPQDSLQHPEPVQAQQPTWPEIVGRPADLELTIKPEAAVKGEHPTTRQQTTAPPEHPQVTVQHPESVSTQYSAWSQMVSPSMDEQFIRVQHPVSSETGPPTAQQDAIMNICELCTCDNETLSCTGFRAKQKLNRVPVPQPNTYHGTFTTLNLKGNSIFEFDKDIWKSYHQAEKLILSDNNLQELPKESFEGLFFLKYLDLSGNNIKLIEESALESLPFLEYLNLGGNFLTEVRLGMFRAWHGLRFLHTLILHHNPLTTIEDPYFFKLPALQYLDLGRTQVSHTTVENILKMSTKLETLILPRHLACCLCQFKTTIEAVSHTVRLHCDTQCLTKTHCAEEEPGLISEEGSFLKVLQARKNTSAELMIEPERIAFEKNDNLSSFLTLLKKLLSDEWETQKTEAPEEAQEEEEALGRAKEVPMPEYRYRNKVLVATAVIAVAIGLSIISCLILICDIESSKEDKDGKPRRFVSSMVGKRRSQDSRTKAGGFWCRLQGAFGMSRGAAVRRPEAPVLRDQNFSSQNEHENELLDQMEKGEGSASSMADTATQ